VHNKKNCTNLVIFPKNLNKSDHINKKFSYNNKKSIANSKCYFSVILTKITQYSTTMKILTIELSHFSELIKALLFDFC
jgi:hypothetical protein